MATKLVLAVVLVAVATAVRASVLVGDGPDGLENVYLLDTAADAVLQKLQDYTAGSSQVTFNRVTYYVGAISGSPVIQVNYHDDSRNVVVTSGDIAVANANTQYSHTFSSDILAPATGTAFYVGITLISGGTVEIGYASEPSIGSIIEFEFMQVDYNIVPPQSGWNADHVSLVMDVYYDEPTVCPAVSSFADADATTTGPTVAVTFDSGIKFQVDVPVADGRDVSKATALTIGTSGNAGCVLLPVLTSCETLSNRLHYEIGYGTLKTCAGAGGVSTVTSVSGDTRFDFASNSNVREIERIVSTGTIQFMETTQYDRDPSAAVVLITDTRTITRDLAFFVQTPTVISKALDDPITVFDDHNVDLVITAETVTLSNVVVASDSAGSGDTITQQANVELTLRLQSWAEITSAVYHGTTPVPITTGTAIVPVGTAALNARTDAGGYSVHTVDVVYTLAASTANGCEMAGDYMLTVKVGCKSGTAPAECPLSAFDANQDHDLTFEIASTDVCAITGGTASGYTIALATFFATGGTGGASDAIGGTCSLDGSDVPTGAATNAFVDDHQICVRSIVTDGNLATTETYISKIMSDQALNSNTDIRVNTNTDSAGVANHKVDVEQISATTATNGVAFDGSEPVILTVEVTAEFDGGAKRRNLLTTETATATHIVQVSKSATSAGNTPTTATGLAASPAVVVGVAGGVGVLVVIVIILGVVVVTRVTKAATRHAGTSFASGSATSVPLSSSDDEFFPESTSVSSTVSYSVPLSSSDDEFFPESTSASSTV